MRTPDLNKILFGGLLIKAKNNWKKVGPSGWQYSEASEPPGPGWERVEDDDPGQDHGEGREDGSRESFDAIPGRVVGQDQGVDPPERDLASEAIRPMSEIGDGGVVEWDESRAVKQLTRSEWRERLGDEYEAMKPSFKAWAFEWVNIQGVDRGEIDGSEYPRYAKGLEDMNSLMERYGDLEEPALVSRGLGFDSDEDLEKFMAGVRSGSVEHDSMSSWTGSGEISTKFARSSKNPVVLRMETTKGLPFSGLSSTNTDEQEVVVPAVKSKVKSVSWDPPISEGLGDRTKGLEQMSSEMMDESLDWEGTGEEAAVKIKEMSGKIEELRDLLDLFDQVDPGRKRVTDNYRRSLGEAMTELGSAQQDLDENPAFGIERALATVGYIAGEMASDVPKGTMVVSLEVDEWL
jgi:hypothetical protein